MFTLKPGRLPPADVKNIIFFVRPKLELMDIITDNVLRCGGGSAPGSPVGVCPVRGQVWPETVLWFVMCGLKTGNYVQGRQQSCWGSSRSVRHPGKGGGSFQLVMQRGAFLIKMCILSN